MAASLDQRVTFRANEFINSKFSDNIKSLDDAKLLYDVLSKERDELQEKVSLIATEAPSIIDHAIHDADHALSRVQELKEETEKIGKEVKVNMKKCEPVQKKLANLSLQIKELQHYVSYMEWLMKIDVHSSRIQSALIIGSMDRSVDEFSTLVRIAQDVQASDCKNLVKYIIDTTIFWYDIIKDKLVIEYEEILGVLQWPFINNMILDTVVQKSNELKTTMTNVFVLLVKLQLPESLLPSPPQALADIPNWRPILLPFQLLIKPLRKRFVFHFYGNKPTNNLSKPEWYFTQALSWIRDHTPFLTTMVQGMLKKAGLGGLDAATEFSRGIVLLVMEKMLTDMPEYLDDDHLFSHLVDEALLFEKDLRETYFYPQNQPGCVHVLTCGDSFQRWLKMEKKFALEKMDIMLTSPTAWDFQYKDITDGEDTTRVPECGESFMTLMLTITDRYKLLQDPKHQLQFLDLQLNLIDDFRIRLIQVKDQDTEPTSQTYCAILNTIHYIEEVLRDWNEYLFFLQLQYHKVIASRSESSVISSPSLSRSISSLDSKPSSSDSALDVVEGMVFDDLIKLIEHLKTEMLKKIVHYVFTDVKARSRPYRKDNWMSILSPKELPNQGLSSTACEMLLVCKDWLHNLEQTLSKALFKSLWQQLAYELNKYLYKELILENHFNDGGAQQLNFDMTKNLFPLFGQFTKKPENYFRHIKEACILLTVAPGSALLLKDVIYRTLHSLSRDMSTKPEDPIAALHNIGVYKLSLEEAELIFSLRTDLAS